jgi:hypothetical protein
VRIDRDVKPIFSDPFFGGVSHEQPFVREGWTGNMAGPLLVGG